MTGFPERPPWSATPAALRARVADELGAAVAGAVAVRGGMSPGPAAVLELADGRRVFAKAVSARVNAVSQRLYRWEAEALRRMPPGVPAPALAGVAEAGDWLAVMTSFVPGAVAGPPWTDAGVHAVAAACTAIAAPPGTPSAADRLPDLDGWAKLAADPRPDAAPIEPPTPGEPVRPSDPTAPASPDNSTPPGEPIATSPLDDWEAATIDQLAAMSADWRVWTAGDRITHLDLRGDNVLLDPRSGRATLIDWGYCCAAAPGLDLGLLAIDVVEGGHAGGPVAALRTATAVLAAAPPEAVRLVVAAAGMWRRNHTLPPHPGMPTHRAWQRARYRALRPLLAAILAGDVRPGGPGPRRS